ncbi:MAG: hypothetical protein ACR2JE_14330 [Acidobacteriaceae bacterium]
MNRWIMLRRLRGPAFLLLFGLTALLNQWDILSFGQSWPLYLILAGVFSLAERAAFIGVTPPVGYPGAPSYVPPAYAAPGAWTAPTAPSAPPNSSSCTSLVPQSPADLAPRDDPDWQKGGR